ncbi:MAG: FHA domain-containing protein [Myxococcales bacterium]|nr:FHA domain-containing protein [Myxococcales bacterium]
MSGRTASVIGYDTYPSAPNSSLTSYQRISVVQSGIHTLSPPIVHNISSIPIYLGRDPLRADIVLDDKRISKVQALLSPIDSHGEFRLQDSGSKNGTYLNGLKLTEAQLLRDGDVVRMGNTLLVYESVNSLEVNLGLCPPDLSLHEFAAIERAKAVARLNIPLLLRGPAGRAQAVLARCIHEQSGRSGPFVIVDCPELSPQDLEDKLIGKSGGLLHSNKNGSLLLNNPTQLSDATRAALTKIMADGRHFRQKSSPPRKHSSERTDTRIICSVTRSSKTTANFERFLLTQTSVLCIDTPPLTKRRTELLQKLLSLGLKQAGLSLTVAVAELVLMHSWAYNSQELEQFATTLQHARDPVGIEELPPKMKKLRPQTEKDQP